MSYYEYIYIAGNDVDVNLYKIGKTTKNPFERVRSLNTTGVAHQLHLKKYYIVTDSHVAEKLIHESLNNWRIRSDREFFSISLEYADQIIRTVLNSNNLVYRPEPPPVNSSKTPIYESNNYHGYVISNKRLVLFVCILCGWFGVHHLVWGKIAIGLFYLFTFGFFGLGWIFDIIRIATGKSSLITWRYGVPDYNYQGNSSYQNNLPQYQISPVANYNYAANQQNNNNYQNNLLQQQNNYEDNNKIVTGQHDNYIPPCSDSPEQSTTPLIIDSQSNEELDEAQDYSDQLLPNYDNELIEEDDDTVQSEIYNVSKEAYELRTITNYDKPSVSLLLENNPEDDVEIDKNEQQKIVKCISRSACYLDTQIQNQINTPVFSVYDLSQKININSQSALFLANDISQELDAPHVDLCNHINKYGTSRITIIKEQATFSNLRALLEHENFNSTLLPLGFNYENQPIYFDFQHSPHLLIRGVSGTGKSRLIHSLLISLLMNFTPDQVRIMIWDSTSLEYLIYNSIPHLIQPVFDRHDKVEGSLQWICDEIRRREALLADNKARDFLAYREKTASADFPGQEMPDLFLIIDDIVDLIPRNAKPIIRLVDYIAAHGRPVGIHLVLSSKHVEFDTTFSATKANIFNRISFKTTNSKESVAVLDCEGAEMLYGTGDALYRHGSLQSLTRCIASYCRDSEIESIIQYIKSQFSNIANDNSFDVRTGITFEEMQRETFCGVEDTLLFNQAVKIVIDTGYASVSLLQRKLTIGYPLAARLIGIMSERGYIGPFEGSKPRRVLITKDYAAKYRQGTD